MSTGVHRHHVEAVVRQDLAVFSRKTDSGHRHATSGCSAEGGLVGAPDEEGLFDSSGRRGSVLEPAKTRRALEVLRTAVTAVLSVDRSSTLLDGFSCSPGSTSPDTYKRRWETACPRSRPRSRSPTTTSREAATSVRLDLSRLEPRRPEESHDAGLRVSPGRCYAGSFVLDEPDSSGSTAAAFPVQRGGVVHDQLQGQDAVDDYWDRLTADGGEGSSAVGARTGPV